MKKQLTVKDVKKLIEECFTSPGIAYTIREEVDGSYCLGTKKRAFSLYSHKKRTCKKRIDCSKDALFSLSIFLSKKLGVDVVSCLVGEGGTLQELTNFLNQLLNDKNSGR